MDAAPTTNPTYFFRGGDVAVPPSRAAPSVSGGRPPDGGTAPRIGGGEKTPLEARKMVEEIVRRFYHPDEQVWLVVKLLEGRLDPEYLLWNGRTRMRTRTR